MRRLKTSRVQHIHAVAAASITAIQRHVGPDHKLGEGDRTDATRALAEGKRIRVAQQREMGFFLAAQDGELVDRFRSPPRSAIRYGSCPLIGHAIWTLRSPLAAVTPNTSWSARCGYSLARGGSAQTAKLVSVGRVMGRPGRGDPTVARRSRRRPSPGRYAVPNLCLGTGVASSLRNLSCRQRVMATRFILACIALTT